MAESATEVSTPRPPAPGDGIADPGPLGLAAFAMTTFVLSCFNSKLINNPGLEGVVLPLALFYGGTVQLLAGMWEFRKGNTFGALAFSSFGAFWLSFFFYVKYVAATLLPATDIHEATGLFLLAWGFFTAYMLLASLKTTMAVVAVFFFLTLTFIFLMFGAFDHSTAPVNGIQQIGGWLGLVTALCAWYASCAGVVNSTWKRVVLPVGPLSR
ncbi:MAG: acetate uptake transporter [Acidimicrobiales bacterium]|jgi:succinate-acetate transporter protein